jgi:hypothetical protein
MSLISEALRKARQEAAETGAENRGPGPPPTVIRLRPSSPLGFGLVVGASIALAAALAGAAAVWWALRAPVENVATNALTDPEQLSSTDSPPIEAAAAAPEEGAISDRGPASDVMRIESEAEANAVRSAPTPVGAPNPQITEGGRSTDLGPPPEQEKSSDRSGDVAVRDRSLTPVDPAAGQDEVRVFIVEANLGYATLSLDYIVYRSEDPFAEINGIELHEGSWLDGFTVEKIERDRVMLRDNRGPLVLRVR